MLEFALLSPVVAVLLAGFAGVSLTFVRTLQADELCSQAAQMASAGADLDQDAVRDQIYNLYGGKALQERRGALYVTHIVRDAGGYQKAKSYEIGNLARWHGSTESPEQVIALEPGEDAWIAELWLDNDTILSSVTPSELHARTVR